MLYRSSVGARNRERHKHGEAGTEDLRQALVYYRDLFDDLLEAHPVGERTKR